MPDLRILQTKADVDACAEIYEKINKLFAHQKMAVVSTVISAVLGKYLHVTPESFREAALDRLIEHALEYEQNLRDKQFGGRTTRLPDAKCTACGEVVSAASSVKEDHAPSPGDYTICLFCGHLMAFADDLTVRNLTDVEMVEVAGRPEIIKAQRARVEYQKKFGAK